MAALCNILLVLAVAALARTSITTESSVTTPMCEEEVRVGRMCFELCFLEGNNLLNEQKLVTEELLRAHMWKGDIHDVGWGRMNEHAKKCANVVKEPVKNCELAGKVFRCILEYN